VLIISSSSLSSRPRMILRAYERARFDGSLMQFGSALQENLDMVVGVVVLRH
jgi:hypothetical protein